jgi:Mn-dependent DtxR family transcriptional regulator
MLTRSEEDHLKAVYALLLDGDSALTKDIASVCAPRPAASPTC